MTYKGVYIVPSMQGECDIYWIANRGNDDGFNVE